MKNIKVLILICIICSLSLLSGCFFQFIDFSQLADYEPNQTYVTTDLDDYGFFQGTYNNEKVEEIVMSFFPTEISENFQNVKYTYKAETGWSYGFEAYLEFTVEEPDEYVELVNEYTEGIDDVTSPYDDTYTEYVIKDYFELTHSDDEIINGLVNGEEGEIDTFEIKYANINKIICSTDEQRIIFVAIGVYDLDSTDAEFLCTYFNRFGINPREYAHGRTRPSK